MRGSGSGPVPNLAGSSYQVTLSADLPLLLKGTPGAPFNLVWNGCVTNPTAELHSTFRVECGSGVTESTVTASAPFSELGVGICPHSSLTIFPPSLGEEHRGQLEVPNFAFNASEHFTSDCPDTDETFGDLPVGLLPGGAFDAFGTVPLPDEGLLIEASWSLEELFFLSALGVYGTVRWEIDLQLSGEAQDLETVVVFDDEDYASWLPQGDFEERTEGNWIRFHAELRKKDGSPTLRKAVRFIFELPQVSTEPGVCLNWPAAEIALTAPDLQFLSSRNPGWTANGTRDVTRIETPPGEYVRSPPATLSCFDWGAFGTLKAFAVLEGGDTIEGHLEGDEEMTSILIPKRASGSRIADAWKEKTFGAAGKADGADDEVQPVGDGHKGDGFTLYEEYRGFYTRTPSPNDHVEGDPRRKDLFVHDATGSRASVNRFARLSGLRVHGDIERPFIDDARVVNFHGAGTPNHGAQHAILVERGALERGVGGRAEGGPGLPKSIEKISISERLDPAAISTVIRDGYSRSRSPYTSTFVHELFHGCNVYHHGQGDMSEAKWLVTNAEDGAQTVTEDGSPIRVLLENGLPVTFMNTGARTVYVGVSGGQHSGVEDCVMRYDVSMAHTGDGSATRRYIRIDELVGAALCSQSAGTGVNAARPFNLPIRYGDASAGCCSKQICVNDRESHAPGDGSTGCGGAGGEHHADGEPDGGTGAAAEPSLDLSLSANSTRTLTVHPGDPVLFLAELVLAQDAPPGSSLVIAATGERWTRWLRLEVSAAGGGAASWPVHLATQAGPGITIGETIDGVAAWWTRPEETALLPPGEYEARAVLDTQVAATGWRGLRTSLPVRLLVAPLPDPVPAELARERELRLARYHLIADDLDAARDVLGELLQGAPSSPAGLALRGALRAAEGDPAAALESYEEALEASRTLSPDAEEPPAELLRLHREALARSGIVTVATEPRFRRGDPNQDGSVDIADAMVILSHLFRGAPGALVCTKSGDTDDSGELDLTDAVALLRHIFLGQAAPPEPFAACGTDPTPDGLACTSTPLCP